MACRVLALGLVMVPILAGCTAGQTSPPTMTLELDPPAIVPGQVLTATATAEGQGSAPYRYTHRGCGPELIDVSTERDGRSIPFYAYGEPRRSGSCALVERSISPGERITVRVNWNGKETVSGSDGPHEDPRVPEGTYRIVARLVQVGAPTDVEAEADVKVTSR